MLLTGCIGLFQQPLPDKPATYHRVGGGDVLLIGAAEADITPSRSLYLGGFGVNRPSTGVHYPLKVRAMTLELGGMRVAIVGIDNLGLQRDDVEWIKSGIEGYQNGCVLLCSSHTHAAPDLIGIWGAFMLTSGRDRGYLRMVRDGVVLAVAEASRRARPATLVRGEALLPESGIVRNSNRAGFFDRRFTVIHARAVDDGEPVGTLLHMACHPEVLRRHNTLISSDFVGPLCDRWREDGLGQAVFVNGALGAMITPRPSGTDGMKVMTDALWAAAREAVDGAKAVETATMEVRRRDLYMPITSPGLVMGRLTMTLPRRAYGGQVQTTVGWLRIGSIEAACTPGEMEPALAERIRTATAKPDLLVFGLVDDEIGYLMRDQEARDPEYAYERGMSPVADTGERVFAGLMAVAPQSSR